MKVVLDTSVLVGENAPTDVEAAISVVSLTELHFGVLIAPDDDERARRTDRLAAVEATFDPLPVTAEVSRAWGRPAAAVTQRGGNPGRRQIDLAVAATAMGEQVPLLTHNIADFTYRPRLGRCPPSLRAGPGEYTLTQTCTPGSAAERPENVAFAKAARQGWRAGYRARSRLARPSGAEEATASSRRGIRPAR